MMGFLALGMRTSPFCEVDSHSVTHDAFRAGNRIDAPRDGHLDRIARVGRIERVDPRRPRQPSRG